MIGQFLKYLEIVNCNSLKGIDSIEWNGKNRNWPITIPDEEVEVANVRAVHEQLVDEHQTEVACRPRDEHIAP